MLQIEKRKEALLRVILGANILFLVRTIRPRALPRVVNPANEVVVVGLFAFARQIGGKRPPCI